jgi:DNA-binding NarL/FixJ family response regulator
VEEQVDVLLVRGESVLLADALACALRQDRSVHLVGRPVNEAEAPEAISIRRPRVVLLDAMGWSAERVAENVGRIVAASGMVRVLVLVSDGSRARCLVAAVYAGASGILTTNVSMVQLAESIRQAARGERLIDGDEYLDALEATAMLREREREAKARLSSLTSREREVLGCLTDGLRTDDVARRFAVSVRTVNTHVHNILRKLYVHTRADAVRLAIQAPRSDQLRDSA